MDERDFCLDDCQACGEYIGVIPGNARPEVKDAMRAHCETCAKEVLGLSIPKIGTMQHDTGGGRRVIRKAENLS